MRRRRALVPERVADCAWRIEDKYSRYRRGNVVDEINTAGGRAVTVDEETAKLLDFAATLHALSDGLFDMTSGVLRRHGLSTAERVCPRRRKSTHSCHWSAGTRCNGAGRS